MFTFNADGSVNAATDHGPIFKFTFPGGGIVAFEAGRITFDGDGNVVFVGGLHPLEGRVEAFCARSDSSHA